MSDQKTPLVIRLGFVGHLELGATTALALRSRVRSYMEEVMVAATKLAGDYPDLLDSKPRIEFLTGLARGADLCAARAAVDAGCTLVALSPVRWDAFATDFAEHPEALKEAGELWNLAERHRIEFFADEAQPGMDQALSAGTKEEGYVSVGQFVVGHCDLLLSFYDPSRSGGGRGGTGWVLDEARRARVPRIIISPNGHQLNGHLEAEEGSVSIEQAIRETCGLPPTVSRRALEANKPTLDHDDARGVTFLLDDYLMAKRKKNRPRRLTLYASLFERAVRVFAKGLSRSPNEKAHEHFTVKLSGEMADADEAAEYYNGLHRTTFALIYVLGFLAVLFAVLGHLAEMGFSEHGHSPEGISRWAVAEIFTLVTIVVLFLCARKARVREKGTDFRLLAEMLRVGTGLWPLRTKLQLLEARAHGSDGAVGDTWMAWFSGARQRRLGFPSASFTGPYLKRCAAHLRNVTVDSQIEFHERRVKTYRRIEHGINRLVTALFLLAIVGCLAHLLHFGWIAPYSLVLTAALPALGAALHGLATHAEFARLEQRYEAMARYFLSEREQMDRLARSELPPKRDELVRIARSVGGRMVDEVAEWRWLHADHDAHLP